MKHPSKIPIYAVVDNGNDVDVTLGVFRIFGARATLTMKQPHEETPFVLDVPHPEMLLGRLVDKRTVFLRQPGSDGLKVFALKIYDNERAAKQELSDKMLGAFEPLFSE